MFNAGGGVTPKMQGRHAEKGYRGGIQHGQKLGGGAIKLGPSDLILSNCKVRGCTMHIANPGGMYCSD